MKSSNNLKLFTWSLSHDLKKCKYGKKYLTLNPTLKIKEAVTSFQPPHRKWAGSKLVI